MRVGDELAVDDDLGGQRLIEVLRLQREIGIAGIRREDDAVIADADFLDLGHAGCLAGLDFTFLDLARGIGDVDRVRADALAEFLQAAGGAAGLDDRRLEIGQRLAERFGDDLRIGKNGRGAGDLDLVARSGGTGKSGGSNERRNGELKGFHLGSPKENVVEARLSALACRRSAPFL
uniref:hypothetical protein n=1 Tax=Thauera sp. SDU_THAU2 TaxID=3136633 RepID=UPI00311FB7F3